MMKYKYWKYSNIFLALSLLLIAGYLAVSLFYLYQMKNSGKQAERYGLTVEQSNAIIQQTFALENLAYLYLFHPTQSTQQDFIKQKKQLISEVKQLDNHCRKFHFAYTEIELLDQLITKRLAYLNLLVNQSDSFLNHTDIMIKGDAITHRILQTLDDIRSENSLLQSVNQKEAARANQKTVIVMTIFGGIVLIIVLFSFFVMRRERLHRKMHLQEIENINNELSLVNENLERFAYVASHDLSEPLRKIYTFGGMLIDELSDGLDVVSLSKQTKMIDYTTVMRGGAKRMQNLIRDLLAYSQISRNEETFEKVNLKAVFSDIQTDLDLLFKDNEVKLQLPTNLPVIWGNTTQMKQLFQNLLSNAVKFKNDDVFPIIQVSCNSIEGNQIFQKSELLEKEQTFWEIKIADNGIGFDSQQYGSKIFEVFQRLQGRSKSSGTGIGLSICKKIVEGHNGAIFAKSHEGQGAVFTIYLPKK